MPTAFHVDMVVSNSEGTIDHLFGDGRHVRLRSAETKRILDTAYIDLYTSNRPGSAVQVLRRLHCHRRGCSFPGDAPVWQGGQKNERVVRPGRGGGADPHNHGFRSFCTKRS